jgi:hypothetical protein
MIWYSIYFKDVLHCCKGIYFFGANFHHLGNPKKGRAMTYPKFFFFFFFFFWKNRPEVAIFRGNKSLNLPYLDLHMFLYVANIRQGLKKKIKKIYFSLWHVAKI